MNAPRHIGDMAEALLRQISGHLHAAAAVVAQAGNGLIAVEFLQARRDRVHGDLEEFKTLRLDASRFNLPSLTHIEHHG